MSGEMAAAPSNAEDRTTDCVRPQESAVHALHVIAGLDASYGGPSYTVPRLCEALVNAGAVTALLSVAGRRGRESDDVERGYRDLRFSWDHAGTPILRDLRHSSGLSRALRQNAVDFDVIHQHGLWLLPNLEAAWAARGARKPLVFSPRGMLSPTALAFSSLKKRIFWWLAQGSAVRQSACIHATSDEEYHDIRAFGLTSPVAVVANGIDLPQLPADPLNGHEADRVVLSLGRIHPIKGLDRLIQAWAKLEARHPDWRLRIVGPSEDGHDRALRALAAGLGLTRVTVEGPVYGDARYAAYRSANLFVLPSHNESFGVTLAEALAAGTPAISTKGAPWSRLDAEGCGWCVDQGIEPLTAAMAHAMTMPRNVLRKMGANGRAWMAREFSWDQVARDMLDVYRWLARGREAPATVRFA